MSEFSVDLNNDASGSSFPREFLQDSGFSEALIEDYAAKGLAIKEIQDAIEGVISQAINDLSPLAGSGLPEGVVTSNRSQLYIKTSAPRHVWYNPIIGSSTGWLQI